MNQVPGSNAWRGPPTSTPSGVKRSSQSRPGKRARKRQKAMPEQSTLAVVQEQGNDSSNGGSSNSKGGGLWDLLSRWTQSLSFNKPDDIEPIQPSSSSKPAGLRDLHVEASNEDTSIFADMTREPDEDMLYLSPPTMTRTLASTSSNSSIAGGARKRREPLYKEETQARRQQRLNRQRLLRGGIDVELQRTKPKTGLENPLSNDSSSFDASSPNHTRTLTSNKSYMGSDRTANRLYTGSAYNTTNLGLETYRKFLETRDLGDASNIFDAHRVTSQDILSHRRLPPRQNLEDFDQTLEIARQTIEAPKPSRASLKTYRKSQLRDEEISERIDDLTRRRRIWPTEIPAENEQIIRTVLKTTGVISSLPAAEVAQKDIIKLLPGEWLNDEVINFYGVMVNRRSADAKLRRDKKLPETGDENLLDVHVFTSFFFQKLSDGGHYGVRRWTKKFDLFKKDIIILPVNLGNAHWVCAAINIEKQRFEYYDSMGKINYNVLNKLREYVQAEHLDKKKTPIDLSDWENYYNPKTPQQANGYDCGVFTSQFIECLSRRDGHFDFDQKNMPYLRRKMIHEIKLMELAPEQWYDPNA